MAVENSRIELLLSDIIKHTIGWADQLVFILSLIGHIARTISRLLLDLEQVLSGNRLANIADRSCVDLQGNFRNFSDHAV